jgi:hypothetical protein
MLIILIIMILLVNLHPLIYLRLIYYSHFCFFLHLLILNLGLPLQLLNMFIIKIHYFIVSPGFAFNQCLLFNF